MEVLFEDEHLAVVVKPVGIATESSPRTRVGIVSAYAGRSRGRTRQPMRAAYQIDTDESGIVVIVKSEAVDEAFHQAKHRITRMVHALVEGTFKEGGTTGSINEPLGQARSGLLVVKSGSAKETRRAITQYRLVGQSETHALLKLRLKGSLRHQARAHLKHLGHPVTGDTRYGAGTDPLGRVGLHTGEVTFIHPVTGKVMRFTSPPPREFFLAVGLPPPETPVQHKSPTREDWDHVADWYAHLWDVGRSDLLDRVVLPSTLRLLAADAGLRVLDLGCGPGHLCRELASIGATAVGVDSSPRMIEIARRGAPERCTFLVADARNLDHVAEIEPGTFDAAACVLALMNIDPMEPVMRHVARALRPGGRFVAVLIHPAFRSPRLTSWQWEGEGASAAQFRRVDAYLSPRAIPIVMNPGEVASGAAAVETVTYHRPIGEYVRRFADAGLLIDRMEEWASPRRSEPGPRAEAENRARAEIPMFLAIRAVQAGGGGTTGPGAAT